MNILITGGFGFIGSHVAEKFYQEGHDIYIIDNLSTGNIQNINFKHVFFQLDIENPKCEEIFKRFKFDTVINLAAQISVTNSLNNPYEDTRSNILGLTNMLQLSKKYGVKNFIFASSAAVYGNNQKVPLTEDDDVDPLSPYGMSKLMGEFYCKKWNSIYGLNTTCFRFSNVYGPRQGTKGEGGVISIFLENLVKGNEIVVFGDGNQTRDFIYVKDVAEGIYRAFDKGISGVFNLSTEKESSINDILKILDIYNPIKELHFTDPRKGDIKFSCLDNTNLRSKLNWRPHYSLEQGLRKTYTWYVEEYKVKYESSRKDDNRSSNSIMERFWRSIKRKMGFLPYLENILVFTLVSFLTIFFQHTSFDNIIDFKIIYIVIMGAIHGLKQAVLASVLSCSLYIYLHLQQGKSLFTILEGTKDLLVLSVCMLIGIIVGYIVDSKNVEIKEKSNMLEAEKEKYGFLNRIHEATLLVKEELGEQVISNQDSYGKVYSILMQIDSNDPLKVFSGGITALEDIMKSNNVSIYSLKESKSVAVLSAKSQRKDLILPNTIKVKDRGDIYKVIKTKDTFINREFAPDLPIMSAPIIVNDEVVAVASIYFVDFDNLTLHRQNIFNIVVKLISHSLEKAYKYQAALVGGLINYSM